MLLGEDEYASLLRESGRSKALADGRRLHAEILSRFGRLETYLGNLLVQMYGKCGNLEGARAAFDEIGCRKNVFSWNLMIAAYSNNGDFPAAMDLFRWMDVEPSRVTFLTVLAACSSFRSLREGEIVHSKLLASGLRDDVTICNCLLNMYSKCERLEKARSVFEKIVDKNFISWTSMIAACVQNQRDDEALALFMKMDQEGVKGNEITFSNILNVCSSIDQGKRFHARIAASGYESDVPVGNSLVSMYSRCGSLDDARQFFDRMPAKDVVSWTAIISAYAQSGSHHGKQALKLFHKMVEQERLVPDAITFVSVVDACAGLGALEAGREIHRRIVSRGFEAVIPVRNALVSMYGRCGTLEEARSLFESMKGKTIFSWTAMVTAYAQHGKSDQALEVFQRMDLEGIEATEVSFTSILYACSHAGSLAQGHQYFLMIIGDQRGISPSVEHYHCIVDLLGRCGRLEAAEELIHRMPFEADVVTWITLLSSCRVSLSLKRGMRAAEEILRLKPKSAGPLVLVSNLCAVAGRWDYVAKVRKLMRDSGVVRKAGCSFVEVGNRVHEFVAGDRSHEFFDEISAELKRLHLQMKQAGYVPDTSQVMHGVSEEEKEEILCFHSERLAVGFAVLATAPGAPVWVMKNLRVCSDCHAAMKLMSRITERQIIVRDSSRFHHFEDGNCSCRDFW